VDPIVKALTAEWAVITGSPILFVAALIFVAIIMWKVFEWHYSGRLETAKEKADHQSALITEYREKLRGATPDEAKKRIDDLQIRVDELAAKSAPRSLTVEQSTAVIEASRAAGKFGVVVTYDQASNDAKAYSSQLAHCYQQAGWAVGHRWVIGPGVCDPSGLTVIVRDADAFTPAERAVIDGLLQAKISFGTVSRKNIAEAVDVEIVVSLKYEPAR
jgi:hypothetical protein